MPSYRRRTILAGATILVGLSGCSFGADDESADESSSPTDTTTDPASPASLSATATDTGTTSEPFRDLAVETAATRCPADDHWDPYLHRTPMPPPEVPGNVTRQTAVEFAESTESYVLTYLAVDEYGPQTPETVTPNEPEVLAFPETEMRSASARVIQSTGEGFVVRLTYTRVLEGVSDGSYTINYYVTPERTVRAEAEGVVFPGPDPGESGTILEC